MIKGIIFDFDGLILDTETPCYLAWMDVFEEYHIKMPIDSWLLSIGTAVNTFDPVEFLVTKTKQSVDKESIRQKQAAIERARILNEPIRDGVERTIKEALGMNLLLGIASSSPRSWVTGHLSRLGLLDYFQTIVTQEDVTHAKPFPFLFQKAVKNLGLFPYQVIAFEDSALGVTAAKTAGIFTIAIPNDLTKNINLDHADMVVSSMSEIILADLLKSFAFSPDV